MISNRWWGPPQDPRYDVPPAEHELREKETEEWSGGENQRIRVNKERLPVSVESSSSLGPHIQGGSEHR